MKLLNKVNIFKLYSVFIISFILISAIFSRTGTGLYIFQFRLGEIAVGVGILSTFYILIYEEKNHFIKKGKIVIFLLLVSFIIINIFINLILQICIFLDQALIFGTYLF